MGAHLKALSKSYPMSTKKSKRKCQKSLRPCALTESSLSIGSAKGKEVHLSTILSNECQHDRV